MSGAIPPFPNTPSWRGAQLKKAQDNFTFTLGISLFTASKMALGPTQPPIQCVPGAISLEVKRPGREADYSPPSSAEVELYLHSPNTTSWRDA
jgi:hypothetical protein